MFNRLFGNIDMVKEERWANLKFLRLSEREERVYTEEKDRVPIGKDLGQRHQVGDNLSADMTVVSSWHFHRRCK